MKHPAVLLALSLHASAPAGDSVWLSLDEGPGVSPEVSGAHVYDPLSRSSRPNSGSWLADGRGGPEVKVPASASFTLELFVRMSAAVDAPVVVKTRATRDAAELEWKLDHFRAHNQFYLRGVVVPPGEDRPAVLGPGHYGSAAQWMGDKDPAWRHLALVHDAAAGITTAWVDHHLSSTRDGAVPLDDGLLRVGSAEFRGWIDEVRFTPRALRPSEFLRALPAPLSGVSFASNQAVVPADSGCLDVKEHFGAAGDGKTDDTAAFQRAFNALCSRVPLAYHTLIVPEGVYRIRDTVQGGRFIDVKGAGPDKTILCLDDGVFTNPSQPRPILRMSSTQGPPGSNSSVNGSSICIYVEGLTLDTGRNNPGAKGLEYHANNLGRLDNVLIRSGDGQGVCGLDLTHRDCGPSLVKRVTVDGFNLGVHALSQEYSTTFEHLTLRGQRVAGVLNQGNILAIRGLVSENSVPAVVSDGWNSMVTMLDSRLTGGSSSNVAIRAEGGLYALRVTTSGYGAALEKEIMESFKERRFRTERVAGPDLPEYIGDGLVAGFGKPAGALKLPIEETPEAPVVDTKEWVSVLAYAERRQGDDWSPAVQAAIDSGARVIHFPRGSDVTLEKPIRVHGRSLRLVGYGGALRWRSGKVAKDTPPPPLVIFDSADPADTVWIDRLEVESLEHASTGTLVLRSSSVDRYTTAKAGGRLFAEDVGGADWHFDHPQKVWVRQWNPESHAAGPCISSKGATIWALGFKTEYESQKFRAEAGAATEILGSFIYPIGKIPEDRPIFENRDSRMAVVYGTSVYAANHKLHILDTRGAEEKRIGNDSLLWAGSRARMDLYVSE